MTESSAIILIVVLGILLLFSAYFSATETAFTGFSQARMKNLAQKKKSAKLALKLSENYNRILSTLLIGNNIVNIAAASLATLVFTFYFGDLGVTLSTIVMTVLVLIFGEISPKSLAKERPEEFACFAARPLQLFTILFFPLTFLFDCWKKLLNKIFRLDKKRPSMTEEEFRIIVTDIKNEGILNQNEHDIIQNTIRYDELPVSAVMTKAENITAVDLSRPLTEIKGMFEESNYSRVPVVDKSLDSVLGIMYRAEFYEMLLNGKTDIKEILKPAFYSRRENFPAVQNAAKVATAPCHSGKGRQNCGTNLARRHFGRACRRNERQIRYGNRRGGSRVKNPRPFGRGFFQPKRGKIRLYL